MRLSSIALREQTTSRGRSGAFTMPAPVRGWNARDSLAGMKPADAVTLENWFPEETGVSVRRGHLAHCFDPGERIEYLFSYDVGATKKLLGFTDSGIYDVSVTASVTLKSADWTSGDAQAVSFMGYMIAVNGADQPQKYDGTTLSDTTFTDAGLTDDDLFGIAVYKNRLYMWEDNSRKFWYAGTQAIAGAVTSFDLAGVASLGGKIVGMSSWSIDGGDGPDDVLAIFMSSGQVLVYSGADPGDAGWAIVGIYRIGSPINRKAIERVGSDVAVVTYDGYIMLSSALPLGRSMDSIALSDRIKLAAQAAVQGNPSAPGWQVTIYPAGSMGIVNVPTVRSEGGVTIFEQHVMNLRTGAWCKFTGLNATCWCVHDDKLYFGGEFTNVVGTSVWDGGDSVWDGGDSVWDASSAGVMQADTGVTDNGAPINGYAQQAYSSMGGRPGLKQWTMARPILQASSGSIALRGALSLDYREVTPDAALAVTVAATTKWGAAWGSPWAGGETTVQNWETVGGVGYVAAFGLRVQSAATLLRWYATDFVWQAGGIAA